MASTNVTYSPSSVKTDNYTSAWPYQYLRMDIGQVKWDSSTHQLSVPWSVQFRTTQYDANNKETTRWNVGGYYASIGGTAVVDRHPANSGFYMQWSGYSLASTLASGTWTKNNVTSNQTIALYVKELVNAGYNSSRWATEGGTYGYRKGSANLSVTIPTIGSPTISGSVSTSSASRGGSDGSATITLTRTAGDYASISSYSVTCNGSTQNNTSPATFTGLKNNTTYNWSASITNNASKTGSASGSFSLPGQAPSITGMEYTIGRETVTLKPTVSYDTNANQSSVSVRYGTTTQYGSTASSLELKSLTPNTRYYYSLTITDNYNKTSTAYTGNFLTDCNAPTGHKLTRAAATTTTIDVQVSATGDTNAPITNYKLYYRKGTSGNYQAVDYGTNTKRTISGLDVDTNYQFYFTATNAKGTTQSSTVTFSTNLNDPTVSALTITNLLPFTCTATATASISPSRTLSYRFSKDNGTTWTAYQSSNVYNWTGLAEETTYIMAVQVKATHTGANSVDTTAIKTTTITTPADQAKIRRMIDGQWKQGKTYININGQWVKAKKIYVLINGEWKRNDNK